MNEQDWYRRRNDRTLRYTGRTLDASQWICIKISSDYAQRFDGQVALLVLTNLLGRMTPSIALDVPEVKVHPSLPSASSDLRDTLRTLLLSADPYTKACCRASEANDFVINLGADGKGSIIHGSGWNSYVGPAPSPIPPSNDLNPFGASFAAILAARELFVGNFTPFRTTYQFNTLYWKERLLTPPRDLPLIDNFLGNIWTVGVGSVGTAALYFLSLFTRNFEVTLVDMDVVKIENLDRSPVFFNHDVGLAKVEAATNFFEGIGIKKITVDQRPLHQSEIWHQRLAGTPDVLIAAANELNIRYHIESGYPPLQIYGTTGENWQATLLRHIPLQDACSYCVFPDKKKTVTMKCASVPHPIANVPEKVDATLPFLSFAAGLMTAAEIVKLPMEEFPFTPNKVVFNTHPNQRVRLSQLTIPHREGCFCGERSLSVHEMMIQGTRYASLARTHINSSIRKVM